ncbi:MAG: LD-carboxypeptidase [Oscillospiraceae bacterium]|jgi:muramoyltetrapeptide carboxypeptidase|nr:LD-carboxypeptidase [Oscillospiraceae bacterium]
MNFKIKALTTFAAIFSVICFFSLRASAFDGEILVPKALKEGDTICVLSPCRATSYRIKLFKERISEITKDLEKRGFNVVVYEEAFTASPLQLGDETEQLRADLFNKAVKDPNINAIFAIWGGYGAMHLLDKIDYEAFRENRKIFVGYSDITAISSAIFEKSGIVTFHGPMMGKEPNWKETLCFNNLFDMLMNPKPQTELYNIDDNTPFKVFKSGNCEAQVFGGNMCLIQCLIGTQYEPSYKDKILFFEEIEENDYRVHRILWQLKLAGRLNEISGIIIGAITPNEGETEEGLLNACFDVMKDLKIPVIYNFHSGHIPNPLTLPIGAKLQIKNEKIIIAQPIVE